MNIDIDKERIDAEVAIDSICNEAYTLDENNRKEYILEDSIKVLKKINYIDDAIWNIEFEIEYMGD